MSLAMYLLCGIAQSAHAVSTDLVSGERTCFLIEVTADTPVVINYDVVPREASESEKQELLNKGRAPHKSSDGGMDGTPVVRVESDGTPRPGGAPPQQHAQGAADSGTTVDDDGAPIDTMRVEVYDPARQLLTALDGDWAGRVGFTAHDDGDYKICLRTVDVASWFHTTHHTMSIDIVGGGLAVDWVEWAKKHHVDGIAASVYELNGRFASVRSNLAYMRNRESEFRDTSESTNARALYWSLVQVALVVGAGYWQVNYLRRYFISKNILRP